MIESEWKKFKKLRKICLERFCNEVLAEARSVCDSEEPNALERYYGLYQLIQDKERELEKAFDGLSRSKAFMQLLLMYKMGLVEENQLDEFEDETKAQIKEISGRDES
jgi:hypothetical protein